MTTIKFFMILMTALSISYQASSQTSNEFDDPKLDCFWIALYNGDTIEELNGAWPLDDPGETGIWPAYVDDITLIPWFNTWFYNGPLNLQHMKKIMIGFWAQWFVQGQPIILDWVINWSSSTWPMGSGFPGPSDEGFVFRSIPQHVEFMPQPPETAIWIEFYYEIPYYNPEWVSVDIMGINVKISEDPIPPPPYASEEIIYWWNYILQNSGVAPPGGLMVHECVPKENNPDRDYGDAPENDTAYLPPPVVIGNFPTCIDVGLPNSFISHGCNNPLFFGGFIDCEGDGNWGWCPVFGPNQYNSDECGTFPYSFPNNPDPNTGLVDEGLFLPVPNTLGLLYPNFAGYFVCGAGNRQLLDTVCGLAQWGQDIDIWIDSRQAVGGIFNILFDWNQDGDWNDVVQCGGNPVSEHALINWPIPAQFWGPASALPVPPPPIQVGPEGGYVWARFTLSEQMVPDQWDGSGAFADGETEDYLLYIAPKSAIIPLADWAIYIGIGLIILFTLIAFWRRR
jgi:hypothetical protein